MLEREKEIKECPECGGSHLIQDHQRGELYCQDWGLVIEDKDIDGGRERDRVGAPIIYAFSDKGLSTEVGCNEKDSSGKAIPNKHRAQFFRLGRWQKIIRGSSREGKNFLFAFLELKRMASALGLPSHLKEEAALLYRKAFKRDLIRGRSTEGVVAAVLYLACRKAGLPRTFEEIAIYSRVDRKEIGRTYRFITKKLNLKLLPQDPVDYVLRFSPTLGLSGKIQKKAIEIIKKAKEQGFWLGKIQ